MKQKIKITSLLTITIVLLSACSVGSSVNNEKNPVSGKVFWNGQPISGVSLVIKSENGTDIDRVVSNIDGSYLFNAEKLIANSQYTICISPTYISNMSDFIENSYSYKGKFKYNTYGIIQDLHIHKINLKLVSPTNNGRINETNPLIQWEHYPGADMYQIGIQDSNGKTVVVDQNIISNTYKVSKNLIQDEKYSIAINALNSAGIVISRTFNTSFTIGPPIPDNHIQGFVKWNGNNREGINIEIRDYYTFQVKASSVSDNNGFYSVDCSNLMDNYMYILIVDAPYPFSSIFETIEPTIQGQHINLTMYKEEHFIKNLYDFCRIEDSNPLFEWENYPEATNYKLFITETNSIKSVLYKDKILNNFYQSRQQLQENVEYKVVIEAYRSNYLLAESSTVFSIGERNFENTISGVVLLDGKPIENISIKAYEDVFVNSKLHDTTKTNDKGQFSMYLPSLNQYSGIVICVEETENYHKYFSEYINFTPKGIFKVINLSSK